MARKFKAMPSIPYCKQDFPRKSSRGETTHTGFVSRTVYFGKTVTTS